MLGFVIAVVVLLLIGGAIAGIVLVARAAQTQATAEKNADAILDQTFDGRPDVTYVTNMTTLKYDTLVTGARKRGYRLTNQALAQNGYGTLIFEKTD